MAALDDLIGALRKPGGMSTGVKAALVVGIAVVFAGAYGPLTHVFGNATGIFALAPVVAAAWLFGNRGGLTAGLLALPTNSLLVILQMEKAWLQWAAEDGVLGSAALVVVGGVVGRLRDLRVSADSAVTEVRQTEEKLRESEERYRRLSRENAVLTKLLAASGR